VVKLGRRGKMRIVAAEMIERYESPAYLVKPTGNICAAEDLREMSRFGSRVTLLETGVLGWGDYNVILRHRTNWDEPGVDYLAKI